jgi:hypothetical protein
MSRYGEWTTRDGQPAFVYTADQDALDEAEWNPIQRPPTRRHALLLGNRCIQLEVANDARSALCDERFGQRWLTGSDPTGTGISILEEPDARWGSAWDLRPAGTTPVRSFGPTWFESVAERDGLALERTLLCPEGEVPWVLVRVHLRNDGEVARAFRHTEEWVLRPRFVNVGGNAESRARAASDHVRFRVETSQRGLCAVEQRSDPENGDPETRQAQVFGPAIDFMLEALGDTRAAPAHDAAAHPTLTLESELRLEPGESRTLWFRAGAPDDSEVESPERLMRACAGLRRLRLPRARSAALPEAEREIPWHAALLTGGLCRDEVIGGHTLNQSSAYAHTIGFNGAARDPLQHALPLVYIEPRYALSVLRNTCAWSTPEGELPYALDGAKQPVALGFHPSDSNLWAFALAAEYAAATGDLDAFDEPLEYHPARRASAVSLGENLRRQFRYFTDEIGLGEHGHVRICNADWNDGALTLSDVDPSIMRESGESVLNSAMAAWVLPRWAGLCDRLGDQRTATEARLLAERLREAVGKEWNGRWFRRALAPGGRALGDEDCWLEVQPWALLCGAADEAQARALLRTIDEKLRAGSPLGARVRWPVPAEGDIMGGPGTGHRGGIWPSINMTLIWAAARFAPELARDEWRRSTLAAHAAAYPNVWCGTLSGPDAYNGVESERPGETWGTPMLAMQAYPTNNLHSHSQPLLAWLRLLGIEPRPDGVLRIRGGAEFSSSTLRVDAEGHGCLCVRGPVRVDTPFGEVSGGPGRIDW